MNRHRLRGAATAASTAAVLSLSRTSPADFVAKHAHETCLRDANRREPVLFTETQGGNSFEPTCVLRRHRCYYGEQYLVHNATPGLLQCLADSSCRHEVNQGQRLLRRSWPSSEGAPRLREVAQATPIPEVGFDVDLSTYVRQLQPFLIRGGASSLPAQWKWSEPYLLDRMGSARLGGGGPSDTFANLYDKVYYSGELPSQMMPDVPYPPLIAAAKPTLQRITFWYTVEGRTNSMLHRDNGNFFIAQVHGSKTVTLVDPEHSLRVYADFTDMYNLSPMDAQRVRTDLYPEAIGVPVKWATLNKGDLLYLPMYYWHHLESAAGRNVALTFQFGSWIVPRAKSHYSYNMSEMLRRYRAASSSIARPLSPAELFNLH